MQIKILILEDEEVLGRLYKKKLIKSGFKVEWIKTIGKIESSILTLKPDIVLLDHSISGEEKSGMDLIPFIKNFLPNVKILMLSNYSDFHLKEKALEYGADDYLVKINHSPQILADYIKNKFMN